MDPLWLLKGDHETPGWGPLERDARADTVDVLLFDRDAWALVRAVEPPSAYEGFTVERPADGVYVDNHGRPVYVVAGQEVRDGRAVIQALGDEAKALFAKLGDADVTLDRLGRAY